MRNLNFRSGDKIKVHYKIKEGSKTRIQPYEGLVIATRGQDINSKTFTVRKIGVGGIGVERIFPLQSPNIESIDIIERGKTRRSKLYYLRSRLGKAALKVKPATKEYKYVESVSETVSEEALLETAPASNESISDPSIAEEEKQSESVATETLQPSTPSEELEKEEVSQEETPANEPQAS